MSEKPKFDYSDPEENEPHLGPWWAVLMLVIYWLKEIFPAEKFSLWWYGQMYVISVCTIVTIFVIYKRWKFGRIMKERQARLKDKGS